MIPFLMLLNYTFKKLKKHKNLLTVTVSGVGV
jgi:glycopeptide antibiotics resistance protein